VIRVVVVDDHAVVRSGLKLLLDAQSDIEVVGEAANGREAVFAAIEHKPDVVLMDVVMPELDGIAATRRIVKEIPDQVIVILTTADDDEIGLLGLRAGASGFLAKDVDVDVLPQALQGALSGEAAISRKLSMRLVEQLRRAPQGAGGLRPVKSPLTPREWEVIELLVARKTTDEIADQLVLSTETVRSHVKNILRKLDARSREEAVAIAERMRSDASG
jgi:two-component system, NarL family, response regulator LiaR